MKKVYLAPQTGAIRLISENAIMANSGVPNIDWVLDSDSNIAI